MAEDTTGENGNGNRATVALVDAKVDTVLAEVRGGFKDLQRQINPLAGLPVEFADLKARVSNLEADSNWRRGPLLAVSIAGCGVALSVVSLILSL